MKTVIDIIAEKENVFSMKGVSDELINQAEQELGLIFNKEYKSYLSVYGLVSYGSHELTGICPFPRLNVVSVTIEEREYNPLTPKDYYVIEQLNIDGMVIWQSSEGKIYQTTPNSEPVKIADSLSEYIQSF